MGPTDRQQLGKDAINEALELFHRRWMLRVIWEMREGAWTFRALQSRCGDISPTVLNQRLGELRDAGLVENDEGGYRLTAMGHDMMEAFAPLSKWALRWWKTRLSS
ncbi:MAG TPA: helix-turn-helix domain-containing protein [Albitalea sp.]|nr:helix-turn-helix domain-containing protein [Albitalea sp.]